MFVFKKASSLSCLSIIIGFTISGIVASYFKMDHQTQLVINPNLTFSQIFLHNIPFLFIYSIPYIGIALYIFNFLFVFSLIGLSFIIQGIYPTLLKLWHLPIEILALSIPVVLSIIMKGKRTSLTLFQYSKWMIITTFILALASTIEARL